MRNVLSRKALYVAIAASLGGVAASQAYAAAAMYASEIPANSTLAAPPAWAAPTTPFAPSTANPLYMTFSLTQGATYATALTNASLQCTAGGTTATTGAMITLAAGGGVGTNFATFIVTASSASLQISACTITPGTITLGGTWPSQVNMTVSAVYGGNVAPATTNSTALYSAASFFTTNTTALANTALVATGFITFGTTANTGTVTNTARIGNFNIALNGNVLATGSAPGTVSGLTAYVTAITVSLAGGPLVAANSTTGGLYITFDSAVAGTATCAGTKLVSAMGGSSAITFSAVAPAAGGTSAYLYAVCMGVSGATIPAGTITYGVTGVPNTDPVNAAGSAYQIGTIIASGTTIGTITHNGSQTTVLNFPTSSNQFAGYLRIYNTSAGAGPATANVYSEAGAQVGNNCTLAASIPSNGEVTITPAQLETACGIVTPPAGKYRVDVMGAFASMRAQSTLVTSGVGVNMSGDTSTMGN